MPISNLDDKAIFNAAREIDSEDARQAYMKRVCGDDVAQFDRVMALLRGFEQDSQFLESPAVDLNPTGAMIPSNVMPSVIERPGTQIGPYKIREQLGEGGMGVVYVVEQQEPVRRNVALKIIKPGMDSKEVIARFDAERQALAMMSHPNIAKILDGGTTDTGRPYFVMELVKGVAITKFCDAQKLNVRQRLELFVTVCQAVQHAHLKGIIHRDLKPSNVLVELHDVVAMPKVIDFGVAKATNQQLTQQTIYTRFSQLVGTPLYMSPEQAQLSGLDIDTRSDVYSLGVMLYELLAGVLPFDESTLSSVGLDEFRRIIREDEPQRPSYKVSTLDNELLSTISDRRQTRPRELSLLMQRELDWIVMKALEKDRERRYESANAFAADVQRYLGDEPVQACSPSVSYVLKKYAKRHKGLLTAAAILAAMLITSTVVSGLFAVQAGRAQAASDKSAEDARAAQQTAEDEKEHAVTAKQEAVAANKMSERNLAAALDAVDKLLEHASNPELLEVPKVQPILKKIVADALKFYDEFEVSKADAPNVRFKAAMTRCRLGELAFQYGDKELSKQVSLEAIAEFDKLGEEFPEDHHYRFHQARELYALGWIHIHSYRDFAEAQKCFERSLSIFEALAKSDPTTDYGLQTAETLAALANVHKLQGHVEKHRELVTRCYEEFGQQLHNYARLIQDDDPDRAERLWLQWVGEYREHLSTAGTRSDRAFYTSNLLSVVQFLEHRDRQRATELLTEAFELAEGLIRDYPNVQTSKYLIGLALRAKYDMLVDSELDPERHRQVIELLKYPPEFTDPLHAKYAVLLAKADDPIPALTEMIAAFPEVVTYYQSRSLVLKNLGQEDASRRDLIKVIELLEETLSELAIENGSTSWQLHVALCEAKLRLQRFDEALIHADAVLAKVSDTQPWVYKRRAEAYFGLNQFESSLADLQKCYELSQDLSVVGWIPADKVIACPDTGFRQGMLEFADSVVEKSQHSRAALEGRLPLLVACEEWETVRKDFADILAQPNVKYYVVYQAALIALKTGEVDQYRTRCLRMLTAFADSDNPSETHFTAWACALAPNAIEDYDPAIKLARHAVEKDGENQQYIDGRGAILLRAGKFEEAKQHLEKALEVGKNAKTSSSYVRYFLAMTEHHLGHEQTAKDQLQSANESAEEELAGSPTWNRKLTLELLRKEAEALIGEPAESPDDDANSPDDRPEPPPSPG